MRLTGEELEPDAAALILLPHAEAVAAGVADLLDRVAPDRKRLGLKAKAGPRPEGFRFEIESARGYPPR